MSKANNSLQQVLVAANRELIVRFEKKIQTTLACIWGEDEPTLVEGCAVEERGLSKP